MQTSKETLERRLVQLEARVGGRRNGGATAEPARTEPARTELATLQQRLQQGCPSLATLVRVLQECNVDAGTRSQAGGDCGVEREAVLGSYAALETAVGQLETVLEQQDGVFRRFRAAHAQLETYDGEALLATLRRVEERFVRLVRRLVLLLEERALLRHREEALMVSASCASSTGSIDK